MTEQPIANGKNGRGSNGRFLRGNVGGPGNPFAARVGRLRSAMLAAVKPADVKEIVRKLIEQARSGDTASAKIVLDRVLGPISAQDVIAKIESLESEDQR